MSACPLSCDKSTGEGIMPDPACQLTAFEILPVARSCWYLINAGLIGLKFGAACADAGIVTMPANKTVTSNATVIKESNF